MAEDSIMKRSELNPSSLGELVIYESDGGHAKVIARLEDESIWLTQKQLSDLFDTSKQNVSLHISNILQEGELLESSTVKEFLTVQTEGPREVSRSVAHYSLDMIISLGYRVNSKVATRFRIWATERLKEYLTKGFTMDDERLKELGGDGYWRELLDRIRDIRSSEKVMYRQVLDLYATSLDYDPKAQTSLQFFRVVQNKLHFAAHGHTAAEIVWSRVDAEKDFMGLTVFKGEMPTLQEAKVAKNYLGEDELRVLNNIVSGYFDFAENQAIRRRPMHMQDYVNQLDGILSGAGEAILLDAGQVSRKQADEKATTEYRKYQKKTLSSVERAYLDTLKTVEKEIASLPSDELQG